MAETGGDLKHTIVCQNRFRVKAEIEIAWDKSQGRLCPLTLRERVLLGLKDGLVKAVVVTDNTHQQGRLRQSVDWESTLA